MKRFLALVFAACFAALALAACGNGADSSSSASAATVSSGGPVSPAASSAASSEEDAPISLEELEGMLAIFLRAANIGETIPVVELDLSAGGVTMDDVAAFVGGEAVTSADNGGIVIVIQAQPGKADTVKEQMAAFRDSRISDNYADFATAMANTREARIVTKGDLILYAVSATGHEGGYEQLDASIAENGFA